MTAILGALLPNLIPVIGTLLGLGLTWLTVQLRSKIGADEKASKYALAAQKLIDLSVVYGQRIWPKLETEFRAAMADGVLSQAERTRLEDILKAEVLNTFTQKELEQLASDLGVPFAGLIASIASRVLQMVIRANDPDDPTPKALFPAPEKSTAAPAGDAG